jgi:hypothetical protein
MTYFDALKALAPVGTTDGMIIGNLNQDADDNGIRDPGPFGMNANDGVPLLFGLLSNLVVVEEAKQIDYYGGTGSSQILTIPTGGYTISARDAFFDTGTAFSGSDAITIAGGRALGVREGVAIGRHVINFGTLAPGLQNAAITLPSYQQTPGGTLAIDIRGTIVDTHYDKLTVTGAAQLAGKLDVTFLNQYVPTRGDSFIVLSAGSLSGSFSAFDLPELDRFLWQVDQTATAVILSVIAGDYNDDGKVDAADYTVWRNTFGITHATAFAGADGNGDKIVNEADYAEWRRNYGKVDASTVTSPGSGGGSFAGIAPEPSCGLLLLIGGFFCLASRCRHAKCR